MIIYFIAELFLFICGGIVLLSGIKKERKAFLWVAGNMQITRSPAFNIISGAILISTGIVGFLHLIMLW